VSGHANACDDTVRSPAARERKAIRLTPDLAIQSGLDRIENVICPKDHAWGSGAHLDVVLADLFAAKVQCVVCEQLHYWVRARPDASARTWTEGTGSS
jgi:hypothetical protein